MVNDVTQRDHAIHTSDLNATTLNDSQRISQNIEDLNNNFSCCSLSCLVQNSDIYSAMPLSTSSP